MFAKVKSLPQITSKNSLLIVSQTPLQQSSQKYFINYSHKININHQTFFKIIFKDFLLYYLNMQSSQGSDGSSNKRKDSRRGNIRVLDQKHIITFYEFLILQRQYNTKDQKEWLPSVKNFAKTIHEDPVLRMNWEWGILQCKNTLPNKTGNDVLDMIDISCKTPPAYSHAVFVGFPINVIFLQFMQNENGRNFFSQQKVNLALKEILRDYMTMLLSEISLRYMNDEAPHGWFSEAARKDIKYEQYICSPEEPHFGFKNWNEWFMRRFKPELRQVGAGSPNEVNHDNIIVNSCESTPLTLPIQPQTNVKKTDHFWLKDDVYSLNDMFAADRYNKHHLVGHFIGGTVYQAYLGALDYHRWHAPVDGVIEDVYQIQGTYYLDQSQFIPYDEESPNNSESFLSAVNARKVIVINSNNKHLGKVAIIYIGMGEVASCVHTVLIGQAVKKGDQIGHFQFGGSTHVMVFEKKAKLNFTQELYAKNQNGEIGGMQQYVNGFLAQVISK